MKDYTSLLAAWLMKDYTSLLAEFVTAVNKVKVMRPYTREFSDQMAAVRELDRQLRNLERITEQVSQC